MSTTSPAKARACWKAFVIAALTAAMLCLGACSQAPEKREADFTGIRNVAELATLKAYYHNVAETTIDPDGPLSFIINKGYKRVWIEYTGTVDIGIDASQVKIGTPDEQGSVNVYVPEVKVLGADLDRSTIADPIIETGIFTNVTGEEKAQVIAAAQDKMVEQVNQDQSLHTQAYDRARRVIKAYVENVGASIGETYTVRWTNDPAEV